MASILVIDDEPALPHVLPVASDLARRNTMMVHSVHCGAGVRGHRHRWRAHGRAAVDRADVSCVSLSLPLLLACTTIVNGSACGFLWLVVGTLAGSKEGFLDQFMKGDGFMSRGRVCCPSVRVFRAIMTALILSTFGTSRLLADDPPGGGDGGGTNGVPVTNNLVAEPFPLNLLATCFYADNPQTLYSFSDLDSAVSAGFDHMTNSLLVVYPPGIYNIPQDGGLFVFSSSGEIAANIGMFQPTFAMGVPLYKMGVIETQLVGSARSWVYMGASDGTNCWAFRTNSVSYDPQAWVRFIYDDPPSYLLGDDLSQWYTQRDRERAILGLTLINETDLPALQSALANARTNALNSPGPDPQVPVVPSDTNSLSFANVWNSPNTFNTWIYTPAARPVAVLASTNLLAGASGWTIRGSFSAVPLFNLWRTAEGTPSEFYRGGFLDRDSDGDGIPDFIEMFITRTDPYKWDSAGTSLGDYARFYTYGLSGTSSDSNADGMDDEESILKGLDPRGSGSAPDADSIRYYYDADDRVAGAFSGSPAGAIAYKVSPAGNHASTAERSAQ